MDNDQLIDLLSKFKETPGWELHPAEVFVSQEQIRLLIEKEQFYYAPLNIGVFPLITIYEPFK
jgi:hypothetical protein